MTLFKDISAEIKQDEPLAGYTWFRLGGPAKYFVEPRNQEELQQVVVRCQEEDIPTYILGRGSNLLVGDNGVDGMVIHLMDKYFGDISINENIVTVGAGASINRMLQVCARNGLSGMECLVGIPGSIGGAVKINAGGRFGDIGSFTRSVRLMDSKGNEFFRPREDIYFGYRETNIMAKLILSAEFELLPDDPEIIAREIRQVWLLKKNSQPMNTRNAGCVFKNPRALSAGALIDQAGLKGTRIGGAYVSMRHGNFIEVDDCAVSSDVLKLIDLIREKVQDRFDVELELEIEVWS